MAGPTVTLTFAGDAGNLTSAFDKVGSSAKSMGSEVASSSEGVRSGGRSLDGFADKVDASEQRSQGLADTVAGVTDAMTAISDPTLSTGERIMLLGTAGADLASGFSNLLIPAVTALGTALKVGLGSAMSFIAAHPLAIALIALAAIFVLLWTKSETFRNIVKAGFNAIWQAVKAVAGWIVDRWHWAVGVLGGAARRIGRFFSNIWDGLKNGAKAALNWVIDILNDAIWALNKLVAGINVIPGVNLGYIPYIPKLHQGGRVPGAPGTETLALLQAGERVTPAGHSSNTGGGVTVSFQGNTDNAVATLIMGLIRSGKIQIRGA